MSVVEIHRRLLAPYGDSELPRRSVYKWIKKFKRGRTSVTHEEGSRRLLTFTTDKKIQEAREMVVVNQVDIIDEVARSLQISHVSAYQITHGELGFQKVPCKMSAKSATCKAQTQTYWSRLLDRYNNAGEECLSRIVTRDEAWVHNYEAESNGQSME
ncbi:uncharacterized protein LOC106883910 [Octopus bimaculoides]|uniref:uncharacterized protein LOC106883910 n=1 Tax=Octopus bimaculoides TaxID=37653 RepID=UPI00071D1C9F|nr:uncharacterized protein LOC106883910 [Octopus bimaculoides]|eukprot:XP_014790534.1 PREDICTED: uncharacterized protein LOC106883910 [Octopus bimaculoides]